MKILIASDIHGSAAATEKLIENFYAEKADFMFLLGDIYNHGPRNGLPESYDPISVAQRLNRLTDKIAVIKGNCDSEVDEMISDFEFSDSAYVFVGKKRIFLTHGHVYNKDNPPKNADITVYGHFHTGFIEEKDGALFVNTGSVTFPKDGTEKSYVTIDENGVYLKDEKMNLIKQFLF